MKKIEHNIRSYQKGFESNTNQGATIEIEFWAHSRCHLIMS